MATDAVASFRSPLALNNHLVLDPDRPVIQPNPTPWPRIPEMPARSDSQPWPLNASCSCRRMNPIHCTRTRRSPESLAIPETHSAIVFGIRLWAMQSLGKVPTLKQIAGAQHFATNRRQCNALAPHAIGMADGASEHCRYNKRDLCKCACFFPGGINLPM